MRKPKRAGPFRRRPDAQTLPSLDAVRAFLAGEPGADLRVAAKAFGIKPGPLKIAFKKVFREARGEEPQTVEPSASTPDVAVVEVVGQDTDGDMLCALSERPAGPDVRIVLAPGSQRDSGGAALGIGERFLAKITASAGGAWEARVIRRIGAPKERILGVFRREGRFARILPVDKRARFEYAVAAADTLDAQDGELVVAEPAKGRIAGLAQARVRERAGDLNAPRAVSLISIHTHNLPTAFAQDALDQAAAARPLPLGDRTDLRAVPLVTIDPADARDHDDAVWAAPDTDAANPGGHQAIVAIADVAAYVTPGSALDREARTRGNSVYFPDRVVPMLPERLSADLCSLKAGVDRPVLAAFLTFDAKGRLIRHRFARAMMRSAASLSYEAAQDAIDGRGAGEARDLLESVLRPLWRCYGAMAEARDARAPLDLDIPEHKIWLDVSGKVATVEKRRRLDAHRLIEEFMIQANVAAAEALEAKRAPLIYRVHDAPSTEKLQGLSDFLRTLTIKLNAHAAVTTAQLAGILARAAEGDNKELINEIMLRSQSLAIYDPANIGHFGLNLRRYAHFTSPIRRYADLIVHRSLIRHLGLGEDGLTPGDIARLKDIAERISAAERRAMAAEREANDRYMAAFMSEQIGAVFAAKISGVTRFGLFVKLEDTGADGLIPMRALGRERFRHDERAHALTGERSKTSYRLGQRIRVRLAEAAPLTGGLRFDLAEAEGAAPAAQKRGPNRPSRPRR